MLFSSVRLHTLQQTAAFGIEAGRCTFLQPLLLLNFLFLQICETPKISDNNYNHTQHRFKMIYRKERLNVPPFSWWTNRGKTKTFICCWSGSCKVNPDLIAATFLEVGKDYYPHAFQLDGEDLARYVEEGNLVRIVPLIPKPA